MTHNDAVRAMRGGGLRFRVGPFQIAAHSRLPCIARHLIDLYPDHTLLSEDSFADYHVGVENPSLLRRFVRPQIIFSFDGLRPFTPLPATQARAQFEWGLNWAIAAHSHQYAIIHAAVVERNGLGLILPGDPGSGKSTLCAGLVTSGWRLLSDEMALIHRATRTLHAVPRPISLKNQSIDLIRRLDPDTFFGPVIHGTSKGDLAHVRTPAAAVRDQDIPVGDFRVVFPTYASDTGVSLETKGGADACLALIRNCFNFNLLGAPGFELLADVIDMGLSHDLRYASLGDAIAALASIDERWA